MKKVHVVICLGLALCAVAVLGPTVSEAREELVRRADNVFFCVDASGSMMSQYNGGKQTDLAVARELVRSFTRAMPDMGFKTSLYRFAAFEELLALRPHDQGAFEEALGKLPERVAIFGNRTPLGDGLYDLAWPVSEVPGPTAVILFTDGGQNEGEPPLPVAQQLYDNYGICLHVVSFANNAWEQAVVDELAGLNPCTVKASAKDLHDPAAMEAFVREVLLTTRTVADPTPPPAPVREFRTVAVDMLLNFDLDKADIKPEFREELAKTGELMQRHPETTAQILGYADATGSYTYNLRLSRARAMSVRDALSEMFGIDPDRLEVVGYGENYPVASNASEQGRSRNRRVTAYVRGWYVEER